MAKTHCVGLYCPFTTESGFRLSSPYCMIDFQSELFPRSLTFLSYLFSLLFLLTQLYHSFFSTNSCNWQHRNQTDLITVSFTVSVLSPLPPFPESWYHMYLLIVKQNWGSSTKEQKNRKKNVEDRTLTQKRKAKRKHFKLIRIKLWLWTFIQAFRCYSVCLSQSDNSFRPWRSTTQCATSQSKTKIKQAICNVLRGLSNMSKPVNHHQTRQRRVCSEWLTKRVKIGHCAIFSTMRVRAERAAGAAFWLDRIRRGPRFMHASRHLPWRAGLSGSGRVPTLSCFDNSLFMRLISCPRFWIL